MEMLNLFLREFQAMCAIPRPSGSEERICCYLEKRLKQFGLHPVRDLYCNLICDVPPTIGIPETQPLCLQAHMDMVCVGAEDYVPETDPIRTITKDGWLCSDGRSTLGADCGAGIAAVLALLEGGFPHGALRLIFTSSEETGLEGARHMTEASISGCVGLINLDGFHSDRAVISSAGGYRMIFSKQVTMVPSDFEQGYCIAIRGLVGGHSGDDIGRGRGNAARILLWLLQALELPFEVHSIDARGAFNVIRTAGSAVILTDRKYVSDLMHTVDLFRQGIASLYRETDPGIVIDLKEVDCPKLVFPRNEIINFLALAGVIPCGVDEMHPICPECVGSSGNLASMGASDGMLELRSFLRSCSNEYLDQHGDYYRLSALNFGYAEKEMRYPAWPGCADNPMAMRCIRIAKAQGRSMTIGAVHAGLETSVFHMLRPEMPVLSLGGDIRDPHTVRERLRLQSAVDLMDLLKELILLPEASDID